MIFIRKKKAPLELIDMDILEKGHYAKELLNNPLLKDIFKIIEQDTINTWRSSPALAREDRESLWKLLKMLDKIRGTLQGFINDALYEKELKKNKTEKGEYTNG